MYFESFLYVFSVAEYTCMFRNAVDGEPMRIRKLKEDRALMVKE